MSERIGFMQGRLSPLVDGRIQAFPWLHWQQEFDSAQAHGFRLMEWTLDQENLYDNPLLTAAGQDQIRQLCRRCALTIPSLTGDCFMQAPFWKTQGAGGEARKRDFLAVAAACAAVGIKLIVVPLVDNGAIETREQEDELVHFLIGVAAFFSQHGLQVVFESDAAPAELARFIARLPPALFGINYDIGNSAALGHAPAAELAAYGHRVLNVHIKDRVRGGTTVPLGSGDADFDAAFAGLAASGYRGNFILQTARAADGDHAGALCRYRAMSQEWVARHGA
ncbi:MAG TPA: TIM barrel protein [Burkholderiaceae bacterium]